MRWVHGLVLVIAAAFVVGGAIVGARMLTAEPDGGDDDAAGDAGAPAVECSPQPDRSAARKARERWLRDHVRGAQANWFVGAGVANAEAGRDRLASAIPSADPGALVGDGWVVVVRYAADEALPDGLPGCLGSTPVLYLPGG